MLYVQSHYFYAFAITLRASSALMVIDIDAVVQGASLKSEGILAVDFGHCQHAASLYVFRLSPS